MSERVGRTLEAQVAAALAEWIQSDRDYLILEAPEPEGAFAQSVLDGPGHTLRGEIVDKSYLDPEVPARYLSVAIEKAGFSRSTTEFPDLIANAGYSFGELADAGWETAPHPNYRQEWSWPADLAAVAKRTSMALEQGLGVPRGAVLSLTAGVVDIFCFSCGRVALGAEEPVHICA